MRTVIILSVLVFLSFCLSVEASALIKDQSIAKGLTLSPLRNEFDVTPGTAHDNILKVTNSTDKVMRVDLTAEEFSVINPQYDYAFAQESDITKWVKFESPEFNLAAGETKSIKYTFGVPLSAEPGGRYLSIFATTSTQSQIDGSVTSQQRVASLLYVTISGNVTRVGKLVSLSSPLMINESTNWSVLLQNTGTTHYHSRYNIQIFNIFSSDIAASSNGDALILPNSLRLINNAIPLPKFPGLYRAVYTVGLGDNPAKVETHYLIYITPLSVLALVLFISVISLIILYRRDLRKKRKAS